jgi:hypothetical protein
MKKNLTKTFILFFALGVSMISCEKDSANLANEESLVNQSSLTDLHKAGGITFTEVEPNNTMATANGPIVENNAVITGTASSISDEDWFKVSCAKNKEITVYLTGSSPYVNCVVYDKNGLALKTLVLNGSFTFTTLYDGSYFIKAGGYPNVTYSISLTKVDATNHLSTIPGSSISRVTTGTTQTFSFTLSTASYVSLYINGATPYVNFTVHDSNNNRISGTSSIVDEQAIVFDNLAAGTYYIKVGGYNSIAYSLYFNPAKALIDPYYYYILEKEVTGFPSGEVYSYKCSSHSFGGNTYNMVPYMSSINSGVHHNSAYNTECYKVTLFDDYSNGLPILQVLCWDGK